MILLSSVLAEGPLGICEDGLMFCFVFMLSLKKLEKPGGKTNSSFFTCFPALVLLL